MTKKKSDTLEEAVQRQAANLDPAQRQFVLAEFEMYQWNAAKIAQLQEEVDSGEMDASDEGKLLKERHQLVSEQTALFGHIMRWLKGTATEVDEFEKFIAG